MTARAPVILVVLIDTKKLSWNVACISFAGEPTPLLRSASGDLDEYRGQELDNQVSFLRHRLAGVLQRGCDRLFAHQMKASHVVFIADGNYPDADEKVTRCLAEHFVQWMMNPPVTYLLSKGLAPPQINVSQVVAGEFPDSVAEPLKAALPKLASLLDLPDCWECVPPRRSRTL